MLRERSQRKTNTKLFHAYVEFKKQRILSTEQHIELLNHYIVHLKVIQQYVLSIMELKREKENKVDVARLPKLKKEVKKKKTQRINGFDTKVILPQGSNSFNE